MKWCNRIIIWGKCEGELFSNALKNDINIKHNYIINHCLVLLHGIYGWQKIQEWHKYKT